LWLTISAPFVYASQQQQAKQDNSSTTQSPLDCNDEESSNPFGNSTEEKAPSTTSLSEEYLHQYHHPDEYFSSPLHNIIIAQALIPMLLIMAKYRCRHPMQPDFYPSTKAVYKPS
jgi:hypothetical protein